MHLLTLYNQLNLLEKSTRMGNKSLKKRQDATPAEKSKDMVDHIVNKAAEKEEQAKQKAESEALAK